MKIKKEKMNTNFKKKKQKQKKTNLRFSFVVAAGQHARRSFVPAVAREHDHVRIGLRTKAAQHRVRFVDYD